MYGPASVVTLPACPYLILLCIIIRRHIHARPHMYHAGLRDHVQQMQSVTCRHICARCRLVTSGWKETEQHTRCAPFLNMLLVAQRQALSDSCVGQEEG